MKIWHRILDEDFLIYYFWKGLDKFDSTNNLKWMPWVQFFPKNTYETPRADSGSGMCILEAEQGPLGTTNKFKDMLFLFLSSYGKQVFLYALTKNLYAGKPLRKQDE